MNDIKTIARNISLIENRIPGYETLLYNLQQSKQSTGVIGITGAPGAGKSTLIDKLIEHIVKQNKTVAVLCVDPSSPFNMGAILGDRVRMQQWYTNDQVFIRSLASRKALGGLSPMIIEITDYMRSANFDFIIIETVGVGQSEVEIAGLADITVVTVVPEGGDEIQTMKSGVMEIADIFVLNKYDRPDADRYYKYLSNMLAPVYLNHRERIPVIKTVAETGMGVDKLYFTIEKKLDLRETPENKYLLFAERAYQLIQAGKMKDIKKEDLYKSIRESMKLTNSFNLYRFIENYK